MVNDRGEITRLPSDGFLIFGLSMSRLANGQSGKSIASVIADLETKLTDVSVDVVLLYADGLYANNSSQDGFSIRRRTLNQMLSHKGEILRLLNKQKRFPPNAVHFLSWDQLILDCYSQFQTHEAALLDAVETNERYRLSLTLDLETQKKEITRANIHFLIEETVVAHLLLQNEIPLPRTLTTPSAWRLLCYPGDPILSWACAHKEGFLPKRRDLSGIQRHLSHSWYNTDSRILIDFDKVVLPSPPNTDTNTQAAILFRA